MKVYTVFCKYILENDVISIDLSKMYRRLNLQPIPLVRNGIEYGVDNRLRDIVLYNFQNNYKVVYEVGVKFTKKKEKYEYVKVTKSLTSVVTYMNDQLENLINELEYDEFILYFKEYGNNYTKQIKGGLK